MSNKPAKRGRIFHTVTRFCPSALNSVRFVLLIAAACTITLGFYFTFKLERTIIVDAVTGALEIELSSELSGKAFRNVWICKRPAEAQIAAPQPPDGIGCPRRTHHLTGPVALDTPVLPSGSFLKMTSLPNALRIDVISVPERYSGTDIGKMEGGAYIILGKNALANLGTLPLSGKIQIGSQFSETDRVSISYGTFQIRGYTPVGLISRDMRELRTGVLQSGAHVRFINNDGNTAGGHAAITLAETEIESALMRVTAISEPGTNDLAIRYYFTDEVKMRPSFLEAIIIDPLFQLLISIFGAIAGYGWLKRMLAL
ncbi:hypothetical protein [uncultured Roseobacter sp.]|uniref:hypothetical protein n=1 Tax=uncultured Roseobacter sp. TaxID=114847 RepID=UPI00260566F7|nr:hypothetical protein [uncultured Roseobacter sp.]